MASARTALRVVVLPAPNGPTQDPPTRRLLGGLGHDVSRAMTPDHALELLGADHTDLLVIDITNDNSNRELVDSLAELPESKRPDQVAIFTDSIDTQLRDLRKTVSPSHVHVYLKPLHVHGLLNMLRTMEKQSEARAEA